MDICVKLPRPANGEEILAAFRKAAKFEVSDKVRWDAYDFRSSRAEVAAGAPLVVATGCDATPEHLRAPGWLGRRLGRKPVWKTFFGPGAIRFNTQLRLQPVFPACVYSEVTVSPHHLVLDSDALGGTEIMIEDPVDPLFAGVRPHFERILEGFLAAIAAPDPAGALMMKTCGALGKGHALEF